MFGKTKIVRMKIANYCELPLAEFRIINYNTEKIKNIPIMMDSHDELCNGGPFIGTIIKFDKKRHEYVCKFNMNIINNYFTDMSIKDLSQLRIGLGLYIKDIDKNNIDLNDDNVIISRAFLTHTMQNIENICVYDAFAFSSKIIKSVYTSNVTSVYNDAGIGVIDLYEILNDIKYSSAKTSIYKQTALRNMIKNSNRVIILNESSYLNEMTDESKLIIRISKILKVPVFICNSTDNMTDICTDNLIKVG